MSGLFGGKKSQSTTPVRLNGIQVNQSTYGNAMPLLYGTSRLPITLGDYQDFKSQAQSQSGGKGGGSSTTTGYTYSASIIAFLCEGPITGILNVYLDQSVTTLAAQNLTLFLGGAAQPIWSYMQTNHPTHALPYDHIAYIAGANFSLGSSAGLPNLSFELTGFLPFGNGIIDAEPSAIITDYCTEPNHGVGFPFLAPLTGTNSFQQYCVAMGFFISPSETTQRQAQDFINEILQVTNSQAVWTAGVGLRIVPYQDQAVTGNGASYTPSLTPIYAFNDNDYVYEPNQPPVQRSIIPANQTFNVWRVEFLDRSNQYNTAIEEFRDEADVALNGLRVASTVSLHSITTRPVAKTVAALLCLRNINIRSTFTFKVRADYSLLEPMDLVAINDSIGGIVNQLVRITEVNDDENDFFTITAEEMMVGPASAPLYDTQLAAGYAANYAADPGPVATPYIFTIPPMLIGATGGYEIGVAVAGTGGMWGGCDVWASLDNISYDHVGIIAGPARIGNTLGALPAGSDPDTANTVSIQLNQSIPMVLNSGTRADADNLRTLCILGGEIISYQTANALGANTFSLSYLRRGAYGSANALHAAASQFAVLDKAIFRMPFDPGQSGQPVWFKFASFNIYGGGHQNLSAVTAYQGFFQGQNGGQLLPNGDTPLIARNWCVNVGTRIYKNPIGTTGWDSDCYSKDAFAGACTMRFTASQNNAYIIMGLDPNPTLDESYISVNYSWEMNVDGNAYIWESGLLIFGTGPYTPSTRFEIRYDGKFIYYYRDSVLWRAVQAPGLVLFFDSSFYTPGAAVDNVYFGALNPANSSPFIARGNCTVSGENVSKSGGINAWDSDVYSLEGYPACHVSWKMNTVSDLFMIGLGTQPGANSNFTSINFAIESAGTGYAIFENGVYTGISANVDLTTVFSITYDGTVITYFVNNVSVRAVSAPGLTLFMDSSFWQVGTGCNSLQFGPTTNLKLADTTQIGLNAATEIYTSSATGSGTSTLPGSTDLLVIGIAIPAAPHFDCTVLYTVTITLNQSSGVTGDLAIFAQFIDTGGPTQNGIVTPIQSGTAQYTLQWAFAHSGALTAANTYLYIRNLVGSSRNVAIGVTIIKVEFIKR